MRNKAEEGEQRPAYIHAEGGGATYREEGKPDGGRGRKEGPPLMPSRKKRPSPPFFLPSFLPSSTPEAPSLNNQPDI